MPDACRVPHGVGSTEVGPQAVPQQDEALQPHPLPPSLDRLHKLLLGQLSVCREVDTRAPGKARKVKGVELAVVVEMVVVLVELRYATAEAVHHHQWHSGWTGRAAAGRVHDDRANDRVGGRGNKEVCVVGCEAWGGGGCEGVRVRVRDMGRRGGGGGGRVWKWDGGLNGEGAKV